jgi:DNA ligase-4
LAEVLDDPSKGLNEVSVKLFSAFKPMLCKVAKEENVMKLLAGVSPFYIEMKLDGERFQLHKNADDKFKYFSRNSNDYTESLGDSPSKGSFTQFIAGCFKSTVRTCILDGEMVVYHSKLGYVVQKGQLPRTKSDRHSNGN